MKHNKVVITGYGAVTPYGRGVSRLREGLSSGRNTVCKMQDWNYMKGLNSRIASPVPADFDIMEIPRKSRRAMSPMSIYGLLAVMEAMDHARLCVENINEYNTGLVMGSTIGSPIAIHDTFKQLFDNQYDLSVINSTSFWKGMSNAAASNIAQFLGMNGMVLANASACASSLQAIGLAYLLIRSGGKKILIAGGMDELHPAVTASFDVLEATSIKYNDTPALTPRPFDKDRDGLVCSEGAGALVIEEYEHAKQRGVPVIAEITGYATTTSNLSISQSSQESLAACMKYALQDAEITSHEVDYINAHATGTVSGDVTEAKAINEIFGDNVMASSLKGYFGHTLGASGAIEMIASMFMLEEQVLYPGLNLDKVDDTCKGIGHFFKRTPGKYNTVLKNAFAFGGINTSLIFRRNF